MITVLVVDDSAVDRRLAGGLLQHNSYLSILYAANGKEALAQLEAHKPDVVVTDMQMPEMNGVELVAAVKHSYPQIPVILMTAKGSEEIAVQALQLGAAGYVPKRRLALDLLDTVERVLAVACDDRSDAVLLRRMSRSDYAFEIENQLPLIFTLVNFLRRAVKTMELCDESELVRISIALEEALLNAYYHGNLEQGIQLDEVDPKAYRETAEQRSQEDLYRNRRIHVDASVSRTEARFVIRDEGPGFNPALLPDPTDPENVHRARGRGVLVMRTFMDEVAFNDVGNEVTLVKRRH